jgi:hypothetical protein
LKHLSEFDDATFRSDLTGVPADDLSIVGAAIGNFKRHTQATKLPGGKVWVLLIMDADKLEAPIA